MTLPAQPGAIDFMRQEKPSLRNSFFAWLGRPAEESPEERIAEIRRAMYEVIEQFGDKNYSRLEHSIRYATSLEALWYARPDLMLLVSSQRGEPYARMVIARITVMFKGYRPGGADAPRATNSRYGDL